ncbi:MAG: ThuA domain-containing protein [Planctomycetota bacterium]|nr:ThuA domain-containing protein [Planctomycetota bacterium]
MSARMPYYFRTACLLFGFLCSIDGAGGHEESNAPETVGTPLRVLVYSDTGDYRHPEIPSLNRWLVLEGTRQGMLMDVTEHHLDLKPEVLDRYDVLLLNNANGLSDVLPEKSRKAVEKWFAKGHGIVGLHAALVRQQKWPWLLDLGGCDFDSDSTFQKAKVIVDPAAKEHRSVKGYGPEFWYSADWSNHTRSVTGLPGVKVLLRVDETTYEPVREFFQKLGGKPMGKDHPIAWTTEKHGGRFFYTELGHDVRSLDTDFGRQHVFEGIRWAANAPTAPTEPTQPRVLLLGDSISMGYHPAVVAGLDGEAVVIRPEENCEGTTKGASQIENWLTLEGGNFDVVHFNFGLHDIKRVGADGQGSDDPRDPSQADPATYARQLRSIVEAIRASGATPIFATTTPVPAGKVRPHRERTDVDRYNQIARQIMAEHEIAVNDLNRFAASKLNAIQRPVNVHFTPEGSQTLGEQVTRSIRDVIAREGQ